MPIRTFWIPEDFLITYEKLKKILKREGKSLGDLFRDHIQQYVALHDPGNPQARITSYSEGGEVDVAAIEGQIREFFRDRNSKGTMIYRRDIVRYCRNELTNISSSLAMANRVSDWLKSMEVEVWR